MKNLNPFKMFRFYAAILMCCFVFFPLCLFHFIDTVQLLPLAKKANGKVIDVKFGQFLHKGFYPVIKFSDSYGKIYQFDGYGRAYWPWEKRAQVGQTVEVLYDPQNPSRARVNTFYELWGCNIEDFLVFSFFVGCVVLVFKMDRIFDYWLNRKRAAK